MRMTDADLGFSEDKEEDKTVTARSRTAPMLRVGSSNSHSHASLHYSPPPVPALPHALSPSPIEPFPRSPTVSVFSIPTTSGRNSIGHFNSTSHLIPSGAASSLGMVPPSPPTQRERRRLRKKSRPPHMDNNVFELIEEQRDSSSPPLPPSTPERERASSPPMVPMMLSSSVEATPRSGGSKTPLLSRIGSVKKWGVRRKRASTGPAEVTMQEAGTSSGGIIEDENTPRPPSSLEQTQAQTPSNRNRNSHNASETRSNWFFRPGGAHYGAGSPSPGHAELKHEKSLDQARLRPGAGVGGSQEGGQLPTTPSKCRKLSRRKASGVPLEHTSSGELTGDGSSSASGVGLGKPSLGPSRRPTSMQVPNGATLAIGSGNNKFASVGTRHASYGSSIGRASSSRVFSTPTPTESAEDLPPIPALPLQEGSRSFMGSVRKISLVGGKKHKKKKSSVEVAYIPPVLAASLQNDTGDNEGREHDADARMYTPPRTHTPDLLPPIELHPPSPPRAINGMLTSHSIPLNISDGIEPMMPSMSAPASTTMSPIISSASPVVSNKATPKTPSSPQSASLGRTAQAPNSPPANASVLRRNSLGDLKIPARISQAQIGLKRDLGMVREFATSVDREWFFVFHPKRRCPILILGASNRTEELQSAYYYLLAEVQTFLENAPPPRATSPNPFSLVRPRSRLRSNTSPSTKTSSNTPSSSLEHKYIAATLHAITVKYRISWECAELLIELGGGAPSTASPPASGPVFKPFSANCVDASRA
ncbi:hypothetical protein J3R82DRAFT_7613 [Butyriboletus roseoflavus]|nr:hypothetical protein J3R82DRAFT_7613 [Butyriboletus roseoflavus]